MRVAERALIVASLLLVVAGCEQLDGRSRNRKGNEAFRDSHFIEAAVQFQKALTEVQDPIVHYNLGLAYSKVFRPGDEGQVLLDVASSFACQTIPNVKTISKQVCVKPGDHSFLGCDAKTVCASSFTCQTVDLCAIDNTELANLAAEQFIEWLKAHPTDADTRNYMTQVWIDSSQYKKAIEYWEELHNEKPNDPAVMGALAGINLKAGQWRASIDWYLKVATASPEPAGKVAAYRFIGNVAWAKLRSGTLTQAESVDLADRGISALQHAAALQPENPSLTGLQGSLSNFRGMVQGPSWASAIERAMAEDLKQKAIVLRTKASAAPTPTAPAVTNNPSPAPAGPKSGG